jgi:hypothetical protein
MTDYDFFVGTDRVEYLFKWKNHRDCIQAFVNCPPLTAIIARKAQAHVNGNIWVLDKKEKESNGNYANFIKKLLKKPNPLQDRYSFETQHEIYKQLFGWCLVFAVAPYGYNGIENATSLWNIPPFMLDIEENNTIPYFQSDFKRVFKTIKLNYKGLSVELPMENVYIFKDITPNLDTPVLPESRIRSLEMPINNIIGAYASENIIINRRGALGILSHDVGGSGNFAPLPISPSEKEHLQEDFKRYGLGRHQWQFIITSAALKWQQMGINPKDLGLRESVQENTKAICDRYGYPPHLLGLIDPTFNNQDAAQKGFYQDTIIPESKVSYTQWDDFFKTEEYGLHIVKDYSDLSFMQEDRGAAATARKTLGEALLNEFNNNLITYNRVLELLGEDTREGFDKYKYQLDEIYARQLENTAENGTGQQQEETAGQAQAA